MQEIEILSWTTLDALKEAATRVIDSIGNLDTDEQMSLFCAIEEDYLELHYSELEANYLRRFDDEDELFKHIAKRREELGEAEEEAMEYFEDDDDAFNRDEEEDDLDGYNIRSDEDDDTF
ncbi:MAG: hypothetical protein RB296_03525 [Acidobacteriota bacterium]|jgi:hypothetical protein|nr:hypothetical protein [Acidobacteriota bacterium]